MKETTIAMAREVINRLLRIRLDTDGYGGDILLSPSLFDGSKLFSPDPAVRLSEIRSVLDIIINDEDFDPDDKHTPAIKSVIESNATENELCLVIQGTSTAKLFKYARIRICGGESVFGLATNDIGQQVLTYLGEKTRINIAGKSLFLFAYLKKKCGVEVGYKALIKELQKCMTGVGEDYWTKIYSSDRSQMDFINDAINNLRTKLCEASKGLFRPSEVIENKWIKGTKDASGLYRLAF